MSIKVMIQVFQTHTDSSSEHGSEPASLEVHSSSSYGYGVKA